MYKFFIIRVSLVTLLFILLSIGALNLEIAIFSFALTLSILFTILLALICDLILKEDNNDDKN